MIRSPRDGEVRPLGPDDGGECDWGDCSNPATYRRYDALGHGWLPCCDACAGLPVEGSDEPDAPAPVAAEPTAPVSEVKSASAAAEFSCDLHIDGADSIVSSDSFPAWDGRRSFVTLCVGDGVSLDVTAFLTPGRAYEIGQKLMADALAAGYVPLGAEVVK